MKSFIFKHITWWAALAFALTACQIEQVNQNPNAPTDVPMEVLLPPAQFDLANVTGGDLFLYANIYSQHLRGTNRAQAVTEAYNADEVFVNDLWNDLYSRPMLNLSLILQKAEATGSPHYAGVAKVLMACALGAATDFFGDVPYSEAFQGTTDASPRYDSQQEIYATIDRLLTEAQADLDAATSNFSPTATSDRLYGGDRAKWKKAAAALRARYALHLSKVDNGAAQKALDALAGGFSSSADDLTYRYEGSGFDVNPIFSYYEITPDALIDSYFVQQLKARTDPRRTYMIKRKPFAAVTDSMPGNYFSSANSPVALISFVEQKFIEAEAQARLGRSAEAQTALHAAITASMKQVSANAIADATIESYLAAHATLGTDTEANLATILAQKHVALFTSPEPWTDFRRTGYPALLPNSNGTTAFNPNGQIPRRLIYPQAERLYNLNFPTGEFTLQTKVWWDQ